LPSSEFEESDIDMVEAAGGKVLIGEHGFSRIPVRLESARLSTLCGWFVSEGTTYETFPKIYASGRVRGRSSGFTLAQSEGKGDPKGAIYRREIRETLAGLGLGFSTDSQDLKWFKTASSVLNCWLRDNCYDSKDFLDSRSKRIPRFVFDSTATLEAFFDSVYKGDGSSRQNVYTTTSQGLAEDMVVLLSSLGYKSKVKWDNDRVFRISFSNASCELTSAGKGVRKSVQRFAYQGTVYCVTTKKNHTVIAGREGRYAPVGQSYGVLGFETFAFYCLPVAEATAALGRYVITKTIDRCKELGIQVLYSDTDSIFLRSPSKEQVSTVTHWADHDMGVELDLDKVYRYVAFSSRKKNYFGVLPDGTVDIRGLTGKKSQTPDYLKEIFYSTLKILSEVKSPEDFEKARAQTRELLTGMINNLKGKKVPVESLAFNVMMGKPTERYNGTTPQHVRAAKLLEEKGREVKAGEIIQYVKTKNPPYVKPVALAKVEEIDADKYIEYAHSMFDQLLDALDFSFDEIMGATTLDLFWS